jgi:transcriptional regulator with XRE-family HTH domain
MPKTIFTGANQVVVEALRTARLDAGLTQSQLAAILHKDQSWISLIEGSQRRVDVVEFVELARALGIDPAILIARIASGISASR